MADETDDWIVPDQQGAPPVVAGGRQPTAAGDDDWITPEAAPAAAAAPTSSLEDYQISIPGIGKPSLIGMAKGLWGAAKSAATLPGDVYAGKVDPLSEEGIRRATEMGMMVLPTSPRVGAALGAARSAAPTIEELKAAAVKGYESPVVKDVIIRGEAGPRLTGEIQRNLNAVGIDENLAPKTFGILGKLETQPADSFLTVDNLRSLRRTLGNAAKSIDPTERLAAKSAMEHVDEFLAELPSADLISGDPRAASTILKDANANYAAAARATEIDRRMIRAELRAAAANSGMNVANTIRQRMADMLINPKLTRGFSPEELAQMESIVRGGKIENVVRGAGNILGGGGGLGAAAWEIGALATGAGGFAGAMAPLAGHALKRFSNAMTELKAARLSQAIRMRSPLGGGRSVVANPNYNSALAFESALRSLPVAQERSEPAELFPAIRGPENFARGGRVTRSFRVRP